VTVQRKVVVPILTEIVEIDDDHEARTSGPMQDAALAPPDLFERPRSPGTLSTLRSRAAPTLNPATNLPASPEREALVHAICEDVWREIDATVDDRIRVALAPAVERLTTTLTDEARNVLARSLAEIVHRAVEQEFDRRRVQAA
jgi:hypothetical protein